MRLDLETSNIERWDLDKVQCMKMFEFDQINYLKIKFYKMVQIITLEPFDLKTWNLVTWNGLNL